MSKADDDLAARLTRIQASLTELGSVSAATREEVLAATEQLIEHAINGNRAAIEASRAAIEESRRLRAKRAREGNGTPHRKRRIAR